MSEPKLEKNYLVTNVRLETKDGVSLELLDDSLPQVPGFIKRVVVWIPLTEYAALGKPAINQRMKALFSLVQP
jgi:hypothetical protein